MQGLLKKYEYPPDKMQCNCGQVMSRIVITKNQAVYKCDACLLLANYRRYWSRDSSDFYWSLTTTERPKIKPKIDESVLQSVILKLDAIANHLGVELVNVPEHFECEKVLKGMTEEQANNEKWDH